MEGAVGITHRKEVKPKLNVNECWLLEMFVTFNVILKSLWKCVSVKNLILAQHGNTYL